MGIATILLPLLPGLINMAESLFSQPKSGETKLGVVTQALRAMTAPLLTNGTLKAPPSDDTLQAMLETVLAQMKTAGALGTQPPSQNGQLFLVHGTVTPLTVQRAIRAT